MTNAVHEQLVKLLQIDDEYLLNVYVCGSKLFRVKRNPSFSDDDYLVVLADNYQFDPAVHQVEMTVQPVYDNTKEQFVDIPIYEYRSDQIDATLFIKSDFEYALGLCDEALLACISLHHYPEDQVQDLILLRRCEFQVPEMFHLDPQTNKRVLNVGNLAQMRTNFSKKAANSYVKCKKKIVVERSVADQYVGYKSLYHCLRILTYAVQIAKHGYITDYTAADEYYDDIVRSFTQQQTHSELSEEEALEIWNILDSKYKPIRNKISSELRQVAPVIGKQKQPNHKPRTLPSE